MIEFFFSDKSHGSMSVPENRDLFLKEKGIDKKSLVCAGLVHENGVSVVKKLDGGRTVKRKDALITKDSNLFLSVTVADCLPLFLWDEEAGVVAVAHAGWRGVKAGIATSVLNEMKNLSCKNIKAAIGPGIGVCHFQVMKDVADRFPSFTEIRGGVMFVNLKQALREDLRLSGVDNVEISKDCTYCAKERYFSYRRDKKLNTMITIIVNKSRVKK